MSRFCLFLCLTLMPMTIHGKVGTRLIASGFKQPVWVSCPDGERDALWVVEKDGRIVILNRKTGAKSDFLDIRHLIKIRMNEQGLLGLAFSHDYNESGRFYVYYTNKLGDTEICRFTASGDHKQHADPSTRELLLKIKQSARNHNGGWIDFGPDGFLYIATGDGGSANDPLNHGQDLSTHLGKILRIDVSAEKGYKIPADNPFLSQPSAMPEIYAYGLRNPWRCSWDRATRDFYIADVGQNHWEEINFLAAGQGKGANFGWRLREGMVATPKNNVGGPPPANAIDPIYVYKHGREADEGLSVTGGYVYRGPIESLHGKYFFADYANPRIWSIEVKNGKAVNFQDWTEQLKPRQGNLNLIASFGEDSDGNLFIVSHSGDIHQVVEQ
ncbi:MAG: PQQ-dependent sugar dehydrogenase [Akkermansiaceae bacterium]